MKIGSREYKEWLDSPLTKALKSSFEQSVTDPENQPSQYGTVTLAMYELVCKQRDLAVEALENCRLLAARHRKEEWAGHIMRFCKDAGLSGSPIRNDSIKES